MRNSNRDVCAPVSCLALNLHFSILNSPFLNQRMYVAQALQQTSHSIQWQHVRSVRRRALWRVMDLHENGINAASNSRAREWFDVLRQSSRCMAQTPGQLQRMRNVENNRHTKPTHNRKRSHIDNQVVITKAHASLSQHQSLASGGLGFLNYIPGILGRKKLSLLNVYRPT